MDLQPYALVLPMNCKTAARNKRKIMQKILGNNPTTTVTENGKVSVGDENKHSVDAADTKVTTTGPTKTDSSAPTDTSITDAGRTDVDKSDNRLVHRSTNGTVYHSEDTAGNAASPREMRICSVQTGKDSIMSDIALGDNANESLALPADSELPVDDANSPFYTVSRIVERLDSEDMKGCIIMLAARSDSSVNVVPLAGGIIEIYDEHERSIQAVWLNRSVAERSDVRILLKALMLRVFAHAYQINLPNRRCTKSNKLVSIYQSMLVTFPRECVSFIEKEMLLSKHYESYGFNEPHNDNPKVPCRCHKIAPDASELFYGISETRFNNLYTSLYEKLLFDSIGRMTPIVKMYPATSFKHEEKVDQISKAVREIERSLREQNGAKKARKA
ncbi:Chromosome complete related, putative [Babesia ovata]|uniref:Chromosome complete related, putative n=1 Tax=Babesia ovata TaxID=189622 RepID=A0A2H6KIB5_9APIC|nr:Chromosome complete related, putative [Babesia ovata]GBE62734.1 Chromosome complete related, putative [Babesia ovata]